MDVSTSVGGPHRMLWRAVVFPPLGLSTYFENIKLSIDFPATDIHSEAMANDAKFHVCTSSSFRGVRL